MKYFYLFFSSIIITALFTNCAGNKNLQEAPPAQMQEAYITSQNNSLYFYLPVTSIQENRVNLDSVYFRGMAAPLERDTERPGVFKAQFKTGKEDYIMSSDPKEEYGNKPPQIRKEIPFKLENDEAILVFSENETRKYYKLTGIRERAE